MESEVTVTCTSRSHKGREVTVASFHRRPDGWRASLSGDMRSLRERPSGDPNALTMWVSQEGAAPARRFRLECRLCGLQAVARGSRLDEIFDSAVRHGVSALPLAAIVATLA